MEFGEFAKGGLVGVEVVFKHLHEIIFQEAICTTNDLLVLRYTRRMDS
jgi:hypothetical protein